MLKQIIALLLVMVLVLVGTLMFTPSASNAKIYTNNPEEYDLQNAMYISFDGNNISAPGGSAKYAVVGTTLTIAASGVYVLSGASDTANVVVLDNVIDDVTIILNGLVLSNNTNAPMLFGKNTNVTLVAAANTENVISDSDRSQNTPLAAISSEGSIVITGDGTLTVNGNNKHGIKADKTITVSGSDLIINSISDGIHSGDNAYILKGNITVSAEDDGIHSDVNLYVGEENADNNNLSVEILKSYEGLEGIEIYIYSGNISIISDDDGMGAAVGGNSEDNMPQGGSGGNFKDNENGGTGRGPRNDGNGNASFTDGMPKKPTDGQAPDMSRMPQMPTDGQPAETSQKPQMPTDGQLPDMSQMPQMPAGGMMMDSNEDNTIFIYGGNIYVNANGDGIDSNGYLYIYGGTVIVNQHGGGNGPLDSGLGTVFYGGTILATGSADMVETPDKADNSVPFVHFTTSDPLTKGTEISIKDSNGSALITSTVQAEGQCVIFSSADIKEGETYTLIVNGTENSSTQAVMEEESGLNFGSGGGMFGGHGNKPGGGKGFSRPSTDTTDTTSDNTDIAVNVSDMAA